MIFTWEPYLCGAEFNLSHSDLYSLHQGRERYHMSTVKTSEVRPANTYSAIDKGEHSCCKLSYQYYVMQHGKRPNKTHFSLIFFVNIGFLPLQTPLGGVFSDAASLSMVANIKTLTVKITFYTWSPATVNKLGKRTASRIRSECFSKVLQEITW